MVAQSTSTTLHSLHSTLKQTGSKRNTATLRDKCLQFLVWQLVDLHDLLQVLHVPGVVLQEVRHPHVLEYCKFLQAFHVLVGNLHVRRGKGFIQKRPCIAYLILLAQSSLSLQSMYRSFSSVWRVIAKSSSWGRCSQNGTRMWQVTSTIPT